MCRCPAHDDRAPSLSVRIGRSRLLLHCFAGCEASAILKALETKRLMVPGAAVDDGRRWGNDGRSLRGAALRLWSESRSIGGTAAEAYLARRGLHPESPELRFNRRTPHGPKPLTRHGPALIAAVRDDSGIIAVHRTFIDPGGSGLAAVSSPRRGLGRFGRGAVRLGGSGPILGLAEGIETALSATALFGMPCWATLGVERFRSVLLPRGVERLCLFLDHDPGGRRAEQLARGAFAHVACIETHVPARVGEDWNDVLRRRRPPRRSRGEEAGTG